MQWFPCKVLLSKDHATLERRDLLAQTTGLSLSGLERSSLAELGSGLYRKGQAMGEGESFWSLIICDHLIEQVDQHAWLIE
jgi:hypothetical protein